MKAKHPHSLPFRASPGFLLLILCFSFVVTCSAQSLLQEGKIWSNLEYGTEGPEQQSYHSYYLRVEGDTTIQSLSYHKLYRSDDASHADWTAYGFMREDSSGKVYALQVPLVDGSGSGETLLYDFGLEKGDSIEVQPGIYLKIDSIKLVNYPGGSLKTLFLQGGFRWIEGIGSTEGLLQGIPEMVMVGKYRYLVCCSLDDVVLFKNANFEECYVKHIFFVPFDFEHGEWYCSYFKKGGYFLKQYNTYYSNELVKLFCEGDTLVKGIKNHKLFFKGYAESQVLPKTPIAGYWGYIRNDTVNGRVIFNDNILYDFSLEIGDSILITDGFDYLVSMDTIIMCNQVRYRYNYFNYGLPISRSIIQGIGSENGLFDITLGIQHSRLLCYQEVGNESCDTCGSILSVSNPVRENVKLYPNPVNQYSVLEFPNPFPEVNFRLFDSGGRLIWSKNKVSGSFIAIGELKLESGIYFYLLQSAFTNYSGKFIVP